MNDASIGAATKDEDAQASLLRFRLLCIWRVLQVVQLRLRLPEFAVQLMDRVEAVLALTDADAPDLPQDGPFVYSTVENGRPAWMTVSRLSSFPFRPSFRIMFPNHTITTLTRSITELLRLIERIVPSEKATASMDSASRKDMADKFTSLVGFFLFELCIFNKTSFTIELSAQAFFNRLGVTASDMEAMHKITEDESIRVVPVTAGGIGLSGAQAGGGGAGAGAGGAGGSGPGGILGGIAGAGSFSLGGDFLGVQAYHITDPTSSFPKVYFVNAFNAWYLYANKSDSPMVDAHGLNWYNYCVAPKVIAPLIATSSSSNVLSTPLSASRRK
jgi:hypothetical protein